jgi:hypothetical protein
MSQKGIQFIQKPFTVKELLGICTKRSINPIHDELMSSMIAKDIDSGELARLLDDFRRALLMHRKVRLGIIFRLHFPDADSPLYDVSEEAADMDFRQWLAESLPELIHSSRLFLRLIAEQGPAYSNCSSLSLDHQVFYKDI